MTVTPNRGSCIGRVTPWPAVNVFPSTPGFAGIVIPHQLPSSQCTSSTALGRIVSDDSGSVRHALTFSVSENSKSPVWVEVTLLPVVSSNPSCSDVPFTFTSRFQILSMCPSTDPGACAVPPPPPLLCAHAVVTSMTSNAEMSPLVLIPVLLVRSLDGIQHLPAGLV